MIQVVREVLTKAFFVTWTSFTFTVLIIIIINNNKHCHRLFLWFILLKASPAHFILSHSNNPIWKVFVSIKHSLIQWPLWMQSARDTWPAKMDVKPQGGFLCRFSSSLWCQCHTTLVWLWPLLPEHTAEDKIQRVGKVFRGTIKSLLSHLAWLQLRGFAEFTVLGCTSFGKACWTHLGKIWIYWGGQEVEQEASGV